MGKYKINGEHSHDKYIIGGVVMVLVIVGLVVVWISTAVPKTPAGNLVTSVDGNVASSTLATATTTSLNLNPVPGDSKEVTLAKCLAKQKITMYGAAWCTHCQDQKKAFGQEAFQYIPYIECPANVQLCISKQVSGYPTWLKTDGSKMEGFTELSKLATWSGCSF